MKLVEPDCGVLDELDSLEVLSDVEVSSVRQSKDVFKQNELLLHFLMDKSDEQLTLFYEALDSNGQQHVVKFIEYNGGE